MSMPHVCTRARILLISLAVAAAGLWAAAGALIGVAPTGGCAVLAAAAGTCTLSLVAIGVGMVMRDRDKDLLLHCLVEASQRAAVAQTVPLQAAAPLRAVPAPAAG
jgi:hypothetical protein